MTQLQDSIKQVAEPHRGAIERYVDLVRGIAGAKVRALTLYGAIAHPESAGFDPGRHTIRNVLVLDAIDLAVLKRLAGHGQKLGKDRISAPLIMTPGYILASLDTFPLEMLEIQQRHLTVYGQDCFEHLVFEESHVRLQCERELKVILIGLRQGLLAAAGSEKIIGALEVDATDGLIRTLRGFLWLKGIREPKPAGEVVSEVQRLIERNLPGLRTALDPAAEHGWAQFQGLYSDVEALGEIVNAL